MKFVIVTVLATILLTSLSDNVVIADPPNKTKTWQDIEWIAFWPDPGTRESKLERMLVTELQGRILATLLEKNYLSANKNVYYRIDPFEVTDIRKNLNGISELDIIATVKYQNERVKKFKITFTFVYEKGFEVSKCVEF